MSKKRLRKNTRTPAPAQRPTRFEPEYWLGRLFHNSYSYKGRHRTVAAWSVKIHLGGQRRTFSLRSSRRPDAAREAAELYRGMVETGRVPPATRRRPAPSASETAPLARGDGLSAGSDVERLNPEFWRRRLLRCKYLEDLRGSPGPELTVVIDHDAERYSFPLGTNNPDEAALRAVERYRTVLTHGWNYARLLYEREFTVALFWWRNPVACTYTTLLSVPATFPAGAPSGMRDSPLSTALLVEPDGGIRRAFEHWLRRQRGFALTTQAVSGADLVNRARHANPALVLINQHLPGFSGLDLLRELQGALPDIPAFTYGVFEDSDHIFISLTGVPGGYLLRRRSPCDWLDPLNRAPARGTLTAPRASALARGYFQRLFDLAEIREEHPPSAVLTHREHETLHLLSKGYQDKEIASELDISIWTVHSHIRRIFEKLNVHSRTEAVVKFLQL